MLRPSTAPRWKTATRTLPRASAAPAARARKPGGADTAARAQAPPVRSARRVSIVMVVLSAPLELGRAEHQGRQLGHVGVGGAAVVGRAPGDLRQRELGGEHRARLLAGLPVQ